MNRNEQKVQDALQNALDAVRDNVADPRHRAMLFSKLEEAKLMHKGLCSD